MSTVSAVGKAVCELEEFGGGDCVFNKNVDAVACGPYVSLRVGSRSMCEGCLSARAVQSG